MAASRDRPRAGFTLIELLVAVAVGGFAMSVAAAMARVAVMKSGQGAEQSDMVNKARVLGHQIRTELRAVGQGSTGAVGVFAGVAPWGAMRIITPGALFTAIPAVAGVDNHPGGGPQDIVAGSDVLQLVAVDSSLDRSYRVNVHAPQGTGSLNGELMDGAVGGLPCPMAYLTDSSAANGAGRTQLMRIAANSNPVALAGGESLVFDVPPGAVLMCARVSTYYVSNDGYLWRSDIDGFAAEAMVAVGGSVFINSANAFRLSPGVMDLQVAYRVSSEAGITRGDPANGWAYDTGANTEAETALGTPANWFEVRQVRVSMQLRSGRRVEEAGLVTLPVLENRAAPLPDMSRAYSSQQVTTGEVLLSLRFYDQNMITGTPAEPW